MGNRTKQQHMFGETCMLLAGEVIPMCQPVYAGDTQRYSAQQHNIHVITHIYIYILEHPLKHTKNFTVVNLTSLDLSGKKMLCVLSFIALHQKLEVVCSINFVTKVNRQTSHTVTPIYLLQTSFAGPLKNQYCDQWQPSVATIQLLTYSYTWSFLCCFFFVLFHNLSYFVSLLVNKFLWKICFTFSCSFQLGGSNTAHIIKHLDFFLLNLTIFYM